MEPAAIRDTLIFMRVGWGSGWPSGNRAQIGDIEHRRIDHNDTRYTKFVYRGNGYWERLPYEPQHKPNRSYSPPPTDLLKITENGTVVVYLHPNTYSFFSGYSEHDFLRLIDGWRQRIRGSRVASDAWVNISTDKKGRIYSMHYKDAVREALQEIEEAHSGYLNALKDLRGTRHYRIGEYRIPVSPFRRFPPFHPRAVIEVIVCADETLAAIGELDRIHHSVETGPAFGRPFGNR